MNPLEKNQRVLTWLCGLPPRNSDPKRNKIAYIIFTLSMLAINLFAVLASATVTYKNVSISPEETVGSLYQTVGSASTLYQSIATVLLRNKLATIFVSLSKIYNENKQGNWIRILTQIDDKCEWFWQIYFKYILSGYLITTAITAAISAVYCYTAYGHFVAERAYHPFVLPWNQTTLLGYSLEICFGTICGQIYLLANGSIFLLFISMCLHHEAFYEIFRDEAKKLNYHDERRSDAEHLRKMVSFHISIKDWFFDSAETYSAFILTLLISGMLLLSCCIFLLDLQTKQVDFDILIVWVGVMVGMSVLIVYCYCGKTATESYAKLSECLYEANWLELDPKLQKYLIIIMANAQKPIYYHGFSIAVLNLQTFTTMIRTVASYYMMFKTLTAD